ncbi:MULTISPECIES: pentapeptide repeat-containing protein [Flavobacteriaceae]|uniref:pentapeptide repeat-containing protein n=1 Tax=Flavobacteriaceae TaxID=49546 RepID=UPI00149184A2|nr:MULTISPECIES: pentapeptide repeat-containing protein [Allomuricauda]MDC6366178.1 pentapeptide repeat-containing protein [Muricauda sp. AC10]
MQDTFIADQEFSGKDFTQNRLPKADYENCTFEKCSFINGFLDNQNFMECRFVDCDLTNANVKHTIFKECIFESTKLVGLKFEDCNDFLLSVQFKNCNLTLASFFQLALKGISFSDCILIETDFTEADLTQSVFSECNMEHAIFQQTNLEKADLSSSFNLNIDPEQNQLKKAKFSKDNIIGLLKKHDIVVT